MYIIYLNKTRHFLFIRVFKSNFALIFLKLTKIKVSKNKQVPNNKENHLYTKLQNIKEKWFQLSKFLIFYFLMTLQFKISICLKNLNNNQIVRIKL